MSTDNEIDDDDEAPSAPFWMTTYSDMVTLLLTFFVLIVSMSEIEIKKFEEALSFFQGRMGVLMDQSVAESKEHVAADPYDVIRQSEQYEELEDYIEENNLTEKVKVDLTEKGLHVTITDSIMFESGRADLIEPSRTILKMIAGVMITKVESVVVEGHTDNRPINTPQFPSNWELSSARAASVIRFLLDQKNALDPSRYLSIGYGEYRPVDTNETEVGRAHNRRVEILFNWEQWQNEATKYLKQIPSWRPPQRKAEKP